MHLSTDNGASFGFEIRKDAGAVLAEIKKNWPAAHRRLMSCFYDANAMMVGVLKDLFARGALSFVAPSGGRAGYLARSDGPCSFCDNRHWKFPLGCPYGK